jgi:hypothetical protein
MSDPENTPTALLDAQIASLANFLDADDEIQAEFERDLRSRGALPAGDMDSTLVDVADHRDERVEPVETEIRSFNPADLAPKNTIYINDADCEALTQHIPPGPPGSFLGIAGVNVCRADSSSSESCEFFDQFGRAHWGRR